MGSVSVCFQISIRIAWRRGGCPPRARSASCLAIRASARPTARQAPLALAMPKAAGRYLLETVWRSGISRRRFPKRAEKGVNLRLFCRAALPACERVAIELVEVAVLHDGHEPLLPLQDRHVGQRVAIDKQQVGEVALAYLTELVAHVHQLGADARRAGERFARAVAEQLDKMLDVSRIGTLRCHVEAVVATDHHADAALAHLLVGPDRGR